jgi:phosphoglycolate phosphatase
MMKEKRALICDLDGVLLDSEANLSWLEDALIKTLKENDIEVSTTNLQKIYPSNITDFKKNIKDLGVNIAQFWQTRNRNYIEAKLRAMKTKIIVPYPDVKDLYRLTPDYQVGIISNSPQETVDAFIKEFNYHDLFSHGIGRGSTLEAIDTLKPHPYLFNQFSRSSPATHYIYIGDTEKDRQFAKNTDMTFYFLSRNNAVVDGFRSLTDIVNVLLK